MDLIEINDLHKKIQDNLSALRKCPNCGSFFKDTLDKMTLCKECDREDKIKKLFYEKS